MLGEKMNNDSRVISNGPFKGKRIEFAQTTGVDRFHKISEEFMNKIFGLEPREYLISDESSLYDFTSLEEMELSDIHKKIHEVYYIDVSDIKSTNLLEIFRRIHGTKGGRDPERIHRTLIMPPVVNREKKSKTKK
jgi:hypothetical protein